MLFTSKKQLDSELKIKLNGKKLDETGSAKFWGIPADKNLTWKQQVNHMATKLNKTNAMLSKLRYFLESKTRKSVYYASFESHLCYTFLFWAQNSNLVKRVTPITRKIPKIVFFQSRNSHTGPLLRDFKTLTSFDKTALENHILLTNL